MKSTFGIGNLAFLKYCTILPCKRKNRQRIILVSVIVTAGKAVTVAYKRSNCIQISILIESHRKPLRTRLHTQAAFGPEQRKKNISRTLPTRRIFIAFGLFIYRCIYNRSKIKAPADGGKLFLGTLVLPPWRTVQLRKRERRHVHRSGIKRWERWERWGYHRRRIVDGKWWYREWSEWNEEFEFAHGGVNGIGGPRSIWLHDGVGREWGLGMNSSTRICPWRLGY